MTIMWYYYYFKLLIFYHSFSTKIFVILVTEIYVIIIIPNTVRFLIDNIIRSVVAQTEPMSQISFGISQTGILISYIPNRTSDLDKSMFQMWSYPKSNLGYPKADLGHSQVWIPYLLNLTMFQINIVAFGYVQVWAIQPQTQPYFK